MTGRAGNAWQDTIRIDMHVHSRYSPDSAVDPERIVSSWERSGILPVVCDHNTTMGSERVSRAIAERDPDIPGILAEEISTEDGEIIGVFLTEEIPAGLPAAETLDIIRDQGAVSIVPHPFCTYRSSAIRTATLREIAGRIDIVEGYNGRMLRDDENVRARVFAREIGRPVSVGSDAHTALELGRNYVITEPFDSPRGLVRALRSSRPIFRLSGHHVHYMTKVIRKLKWLERTVPGARERVASVPRTVENAG